MEKNKKPGEGLGGVTGYECPVPGTEVDPEWRTRPKKRAIPLSEVEERLHEYLERVGAPVTHKALFSVLRNLGGFVAEQIVQNEYVRIPRLGTFRPSITGERRALDINTGESVIVPMARRLRFFPSGKLAREIKHQNIPEEEHRRKVRSPKREKREREERERLAAEAALNNKEES